jgi:hypothetical protein
MSCTPSLFQVQLTTHTNQIGSKQQYMYSMVVFKTKILNHHLGCKALNNSFQIANVVLKITLEVLVGQLCGSKRCCDVSQFLEHAIQRTHPQLYAEHGLLGITS